MVDVQQATHDAEKHNAQHDRTEPANLAREEGKLLETHTPSKERGVQVAMSSRREGEKAELGRTGVRVAERHLESERRETQMNSMEGGLKVDAKSSVAVGGSGSVREGGRMSECSLHSTSTATGTAAKHPGQTQYAYVWVVVQLGTWWCPLSMVVSWKNSII